ncbi:TasA family protein [Pseudonocardia nigra]|uniref:TasA family protein n=1 Tax=Pseudonocardia nigra TaxID=1921578 RepID=UPI001C605106|nr:TasA family protein [Pseudonocardia nigra]
MSVLQNNKKAAAGIGVAAVAAAVVALGAGTYAAFTDTEDTQATFAAGSLDLEVGGFGDAGTLQFADLAPGWSEEHVVSIDNVGTIDGVLKFTVDVTGSDNTCTEPEETDGRCSTNGDLAEAITVSVPGAGTYTLAQLDDEGLGGIPLAAEGGAQSYTLTFAIPDTVGNEIQSDSAVVAIEAILEQAGS